MSMSDYNRGYSAGKSAGRRQGREEGRREAFAEVDKAEAHCLAGIVGSKPEFHQGIQDAQAYIDTAYEYEDLEKYVDEEAIEVGFRSWKTLWLKKNEADHAHEAQVEDDAKTMLIKHFLTASNAFTGEELFNTAFFGMKNLKGKMGLEFQRGYAADLVARLTTDDYHRIGFLSRLYSVAKSIRNVDADNLIENDPDARNSAIEHYETFLEKALEQTGEQVASHLEENASGAYVEYMQHQQPGYNGPEL